VTTGNLNKAVQRNLDRFPADFMFQLSAEEMANLEPRISASENTEPALIFQSGTSKGRGGRRHLPHAFTEQGVAMLSSVLRSPRAVEANIALVEAISAHCEAKVVDLVSYAGQT
jgi:hypothetical protein